MRLYLFPGLALLLLSAALPGQSLVPVSDASPATRAQAEQLYASGHFAAAGEVYRTLLQRVPDDSASAAGLARSLLRQDQSADAYDTASRALQASPNSSALHEAMGEIQFRRAQMNDAEFHFQAALRLDPENASATLGLAHLYRSLSLFNKAYLLLLRAHQIAPNDPDVQRNWIGTLPRSQRIEASEAYLAAHGSDLEENISIEHWLEYLKATQGQPAHNCRLVNTLNAADMRLVSLMHDANHIRGFGLEVKLNDHTAKLRLDTDTRGIILGRKSAERANAVRISAISFGGGGAERSHPGYRALVDHIRIGPLQFQDCIVNVSESAGVVEEDDGLIGVSVFSAYLVDLDFPGRGLHLSPLPRIPDDPVSDTALNTLSDDLAFPQESPPAPPVNAAPPDSATAVSISSALAAVRRPPRDRYIAPEMKSWTHVFRFGPELLIPTEVNNSKPLLFLIDTGESSDILSLGAARSVTTIDRTPWHVRGTSGPLANVYTAPYIKLRFGDYSRKNSTILTFDLSPVSHSTGTEISGILGFSTLQNLEIKIDYRDGLVNFSYDPKRLSISRF